MSRLFDLFEKRERAYAELKKDGGLIVLSPEGVAKHKAALKEFEHWDEQFREEMRQAAEAQRQVEYVHDDLDRLHERFSEPGGWSLRELREAIERAVPCGACGVRFGARAVRRFDAVNCKRCLRHGQRYGD